MADQIQQTGFDGGTGGGGGGTGTVTSVSIATANGISGTSNGSATAPALTLTLGAITPTSVNKVTITAPATGATLTLADGSSLTTTGAFAGGLAYSGAYTLTIPATGTAALGTGTANNIAVWSGTNTISKDTNLQWVDGKLRIVEVGSTVFNTALSDTKTNDFTDQRSYGLEENAIYSSVRANTVYGGFEAYGIALTDQTIPYSLVGFFNQVTAITGYPAIQMRGGKRSGTNFAALSGTDRLFGITADMTGNTTNCFLMTADGKSKFGYDDGAAALRMVEILDASNPQLRLTQANASKYADLQVNSSGDLIITPSSQKVQRTGLTGNNIFHINEAGFTTNAFSIGLTTQTLSYQQVSNSTNGGVTQAYISLIDTTPATTFQGFNSTTGNLTSASLFRFQGFRRSGTGLVALVAADKFMSFYGVADNDFLIMGNGATSIGTHADPTSGTMLDVGGNIRLTGYIQNTLGIGIAAVSTLDILDQSGSGGASHTYKRRTGLTHGMTDLFPTNVFQATGYYHATNGGYQSYALSAVDGIACSMVGIIGSTTPTAPVFEYRVFKKNGTTVQALAAGEIHSQWTNASVSTIIATMLANGSMFFGGTSSPTAKLHIASSSGAANTAAMQFASGTTESTARAGIMEYNNSFYQTKNSALRYGLGGVIFDNYTDAGNSTTTKTDLYSYTTPASALASNGEKIQAQYGGVFVSSGTATREITVSFAGTDIFDTGTLTLSISASWVVDVTIIRVSSSVVRYMITLNTQGAALSAYTSSGELTGLTLTNTNILKITGQAAGVGAATNDIVAKAAFGKWYPASNN